MCNEDSARPVENIVYLTDDTMVAMAWLRKLWRKTRPLSGICAPPRHLSHFALQNAMYVCNVASGMVWSVMLCSEVPRLTRHGAAYHEFVHEQRSFGKEKKSVWDTVPELDLYPVKKMFGETRHWEKFLQSILVGLRHSGSYGYFASDEKSTEQMLEKRKNLLDDVKYLPNFARERSPDRRVQESFHKTFMERVHLQHAEDHPLDTTHGLFSSCPKCGQMGLSVQAGYRANGWFVYNGICTNCDWRTGRHADIADVHAEETRALMQKN